MPNVANVPIGPAIASLQAAGLTVLQGEREYDNSGAVPLDNVLRVDAVTDPSGAQRPYRVGDTVTVHVSKGQDLVTVPNVVGDAWSTAKKALLDAGLVPKYNATADALAGVKVSSLDPVAGTKVVRGASVTVLLTATL
jgi:beta-lactam-binding protein with PASTA domain